MSSPLFRRSGPEDDARKARPRRSSRSSAAQKRQPQRGIGVAQLERLRLQERWRRTAVADYAPPECGAAGTPAQIQLPVYAAPYAVPWGEEYFVPRLRPLEAAPGEVQFLCPAPLCGDRAESSVETEGGSLPRAVAAAELSSNQSLQCLSENCDLCLKKRALGISDKLGFAHYWSLKPARPDLFAPPQVWAKKTAELKEYEFFPIARSMAADRDHAFPASLGDSYSYYSNPSSVDLSLKLSI